jgi:hypothetical protein
MAARLAIPSSGARKRLIHSVITLVSSRAVSLKSNSNLIGIDNQLIDVDLRDSRSIAQGRIPSWTLGQMEDDIGEVLQSEALENNLKQFLDTLSAFEIRSESSSYAQTLVTVEIYKPGPGLILESGRVLDYDTTTTALLKVSRDRKYIIVRWWNTAAWHQEKLVGFREPQSLEFHYLNEQLATEEALDRPI